MHKIPIQIRFSDIDKLGHVNNSIYNQYLDVARFDYFHKIIGDDIDWKNKTIVLVHIDNDFLMPTFIEDTIFVESEITKIGNRSIEMIQNIVDEKGNVRVKARSIFSTLNPSKNESFAFPDNWKKEIEKFENKIF